MLAVAGPLPMAMTSVPSLSASPDDQRLLPLDMISEPLPVLLIGPVCAAFWVIAAPMIRPIGERPETLITGLALPNSRVAACVVLVKPPLMVGVLA